MPNTTLPRLLTACAAFTAFRKIGVRGWLAVMLCLLVGPAAWSADLQKLHGHVPAAVAHLAPAGRLDGTKELNLAIGLPLRNQAILSKFLQDVYTPTSPSYRKFLTPAQFAEQFGPTEADYQAVIKFAKANGLTVTVTHPNRVILDVKGSTANIEKALHVTLQTYQHPTEARQFYAPSTEPSLDLSIPILNISGLDNYSLPRPRLQARPAVQAANAAPNAGSGPSGGYMGNDFRAAYVPGSALIGTGQTVGLLQFDGYTASDITYYEALAGLPNVPITNVLLDGFTGTPTGNGGEVEVSLDIQMSMSMAPGLSQIIVYEAGPYGNWHDILNRMATDNLAKQLSCSWYSPGGTADPVADGIFQQMASQGQSFYSASGDYDAFTGLIPFPGDTPYITEVGGTMLTTGSAGGAWTAEQAWNRNNGIGTGGGISTQYAIPAWQQGISMTANQGSTTMRNVPDVALTAENVYVRADGLDYSVGGTSCAAPLWAGFTALVNQQTANNGIPTIGFINPAVYAIGQNANYTAAFHDTTVGNNFSSGSPNMFSAVSGYDLCTGWGTPTGGALINALVGSLANLGISLSANNVTEGSGPITATLTINPVPTSSTVVNLSSSDPSSATVPASVTFSAGQSSTTFPVTIIDDSLLNGSRSVAITAAANGYGNGTATLVVNDNETATLSISALSSVSETAGTVQGTLNISAPPAVPVSVTVSSSDTTVLQVPATVTIPAGQTSVNFTITVVNNNLINGTQSATITAHVTNWTDGAAAISVVDPTNTNLAISLPATVAEGGTATGTVSLYGKQPSALTVALSSNNTGRLTVPASVVIPAGSTSAAFTVTAPQNSVADGTASVTVTASASGFANATGNVTVLDDHVDHFAFSTILSPQVIGTPFAITITALDPSNAPMPGFTGTVNLTGSSGVTVTPATSGNFVSGQWTGNISLAGTAGNTTLTATNAAGATGQSNTFTLILPVVSTYSLASNDIIYDPGTQKIYLSVPSTDTSGRANTIIPFDPNTGVIGTPVAVGMNPSKLAVSDDHQFLYVGLLGANSISRVTLATQTVGLQINLGTSVYGTVATEDIQVLPGAPHSIAVLPMADSDNIGVEIFDDAVQRATAVSGLYNATSIAFGSTANALYGANGEDTGFDFRRYSISSTGITQTDTLPSTFNAFGVTIKGSATLLFASDGTVLDPVNRVLVAKLPVSGPMQPDVANGRVYYLAQGSGSPQYILHVFSTTTFAEIGSVAVNGVSGTPSSLISWPGGLAFRTSGNQIYLINTSLVAPPANTADLLLTQIASPTPVVAGQSLTFTFYVTNNGPVAAANVSVNDTLPAGVTYVSSTSSQGTVSASGGIVTANLGTLASGANATVTVTVVPQSAGTISNTGTATTTTTDPNQTNNSATQTVTVNTPTAGATQVMTLPLATNDLAYDSVGDRLYASVPSSGGAIANCLAGIVPETGGISFLQFIGSNPSRLARSGDSQFLYAGLLGANSVSRFSLATQTVGLQISLGSDPEAGFLTAEDIAVLPGSPTSFAVVRLEDNYDSYGVAVYDNNVERPTAISGYYITTSIAFGSSATTLYGYDDETTGYDFDRFTITGSGVAELDTTSNLISGFSTTIKGDAGLIYASNGAVVNPQTKSLVNTFPASNLVCPDSARNRVYFLTQSGASATLTAFNQTTLALTDTTTINGISGTAGSLIRCGGNRLAFRTNNNQVYIVTDATLVPSILALTVPATTVKGAGTLPSAGTVAVSEPQSANTVISLASSDTTKITVPATVTIPAGQLSASFDVTVIDNKILDGPHVAVVTASATGFAPATGNIEVEDNEPASFTVTLPATATQGTTVQGTVTISAPPATNIVVYLSSNSPYVTVPASVTILAGQTSATFNITILEAGQVIGTQSAAITAHVDNWTDGTTTFSVLDGVSPANWPTFGNGAGHTGFQPVALGAIPFVAGWAVTYPTSTSGLNQVAVGGGSVFVTPYTYFGDSYVSALDAATGASLWRYTYTNAAYSVNPPTFEAGSVYVQRGNSTTPGDDAALWCFNASTGTPAWNTLFGAQWENYYAPTVINGGVWVDGGTYGGLYGFNVSDGSERFFNSKLEQYDEWTPTYYNGVIYTWVDGNFRAHDPGTGVVLWSLALGGQWYSGGMNTIPVIYQGRAFVVGSPNFYAIDLTTQTSPWSVAGTFKGSPAAANGVVYVLTGSNINAYNTHSGALLGTYATGDSGVTGQPLITNDSLIVASSTATYVFNLATYALEQTLPKGGLVSLANNILYLAGGDGVLRTYYPSGTTLADVSISQTLSPNPAANGTTVTITLTAHNSGPSTSSSVVVSDPLPAGLTYVSATSSQGSCTQSGGTVTCALGNLASGASATVTIKATSNGAGNQTNTAVITSATYDPNNGNNNSSVLLNLAPPIVTTLAPGPLGYYTTLNATVNPNGASTAVSFQYGLTTAYGSTITATPSPIAGTSGATSVTAAVYSLSANTIYHCCAVGTNIGGTAYGADVAFRTPNNNSNLSNLVLSAGTLTPVFSSGTTQYTTSVPYTASSITVTPTLADSNATVTVNGTLVASGTASAPVSLSVGANYIDVICTAENGSTSSYYYLTVTRASPSTNAYLSNLVLSVGTLSPIFASGTTGYTASVPYTTSSLTVTPTVADTTATVKVNGVTAASGSPSGAISLAVGANTIHTIVTAQNGVTTVNYSVVVTRATPSTNATLSNLVLSAGPLSPVFASGTTSYTATVPYTTSVVTVTPTVASSAATVKVNGVALVSGAASAPIGLNTGANTISTVVTAQDGVTTDIYSLTVTRLTGLQNWRQTYFGTTANSGDTADTGDYDHNGIPNLAKYAFGLNPTLPSSNQIPQPIFNGNTYGISFIEPPGISGITYGAQWTSTLNPPNWLSVPDTGSGATHIFSISVGTNPAIFMRLQVTGQ